MREYADELPRRTFTLRRPARRTVDWSEVAQWRLTRPGVIVPSERGVVLEALFETCPLRESKSSSALIVTGTAEVLQNDSVRSWLMNVPGFDAIVLDGMRFVPARELDRELLRLVVTMVH